MKTRRPDFAASAHYVASAVRMAVLVHDVKRPPSVVRKYISPKLVVRVTRKRYKRSLSPAFDPRKIELIVTVGRPNYEERKFIAACVKAREPFPVKRYQLKYPAPRRAKGR